MSPPSLRTAVIMQSRPTSWFSCVLILCRPWALLPPLSQDHQVQTVTPVTHLIRVFQNYFILSYYIFDKYISLPSVWLSDPASLCLLPLSCLQAPISQAWDRETETPFPIRGWRLGSSAAAPPPKHSMVEQSATLASVPILVFILALKPSTECQAKELAFCLLPQ